MLTYRRDDRHRQARADQEPCAASSRLATDNSAGDPALLDTLDRALLLLKQGEDRARGPAAAQADRRDRRRPRSAPATSDRVTRAGKRAAKEGVRIHTLAYSPNDVRRPMLALGELSKRSLGTFRWVRKAAPDSWKAAFEQLRDEINKQYVLTYFVDRRRRRRRARSCTSSRSAAPRRRRTRSRFRAPTCGGERVRDRLLRADKCVRTRAVAAAASSAGCSLIGGIAVGGVVAARRDRLRHHEAPASRASEHARRRRCRRRTPKAPKPKKPKPAPPPSRPGLLPNGRPIPALLDHERSAHRRAPSCCVNGFLIGKQPGCDLMIEDGYTSSQHAQIGMDAHRQLQALRPRLDERHVRQRRARHRERARSTASSIKIGSTEMRFLAE